MQIMEYAGRQKKLYGRKKLKRTGIRIGNAIVLSARQRILARTPLCNKVLKAGVPRL